MTKFGVYRGKDKAFRKQYASGGDVSNPSGATSVSPEEADSIRGHLSERGVDPVEQMKKMAKDRQAFQAANPSWGTE